MWKISKISSEAWKTYRHVRTRVPLNSSLTHKSHQWMLCLIWTINVHFTRYRVSVLLAQTISIFARKLFAFFLLRVERCVVFWWEVDLDHSHHHQLISAATFQNAWILKWNGLFDISMWQRTREGDAKKKRVSLSRVVLVWHSTSLSWPRLSFVVCS